MKKYTLKRIITSLFTLLAILLVLFILMQLMPGSPFNDEKLTPEMRASLYAKYGLDQPIYVQFFRYVTNMLRGDFGVSYNISKNTPISQLIQSRLPISIRVGGMAVTLGAIVGLVLGIIAALKRDTIFDTLATIISVIGVSVPSYVIALALSYTFGFKLKWFPMLFSAKDVFGSSVLPSISLSMFTMASIARFTRSEMIEVLDSDYMLLAESKGISGPALFLRKKRTRTSFQKLCAAKFESIAISASLCLSAKSFSLKVCSEYMVSTALTMASAVASPPR